VKTRLCDLLQIRYPIIHGAVPVPQKAQLAAAVSEAGGLGTAFSLVKPEELREQIREIRKLTDKPFSINLPLLFGEKTARDIAEVVMEEKVKVVTTSSGSPEIFTRRFKEAGITVMHVVSTVKHAIKAEAAGVDVIIASGAEAGGWQSYDEVTTMVLIPQVASAVRVPVVAAGGIADARGFVAALALGAVGVQIGTLFIATVEAGAEKEWNDDIIRATDTSTEITGRGKRPLRVFKVDFLKEARPGTEVKPQASPRGTAGQVAGLITRVSPVKEIIDEIIGGSTAISQSIASSLSG